MDFNYIKRFLKNSQSESGSALILVLLITALLATITVSFLSTSRVEQIAAKNFSRQNAAAGLAELATQQAMGKIQQGFTANGTGTTVITTQPGAIRQFVFQNGSCSEPSPVNLYSENGTAGADMNNLQNPSNTSQVRGNNSDNQTFSITGNATNRLIVKMEDIYSNSKLIGRIAYYVDDELTKININASTDNRTTLNVSIPRHMSLSAFTGSNLTTFRNIIDGNGSSTSNMTNWGYFFRKEQADKILGFNGNQMSNISTAPLSDFHLKYTPWGARRLHINDEPLNSAGVENVFSALSSQHLTDIYGQNFNDKYGQSWSWTGNYGQSANTTVNGLKQTIANMLQMRTPGSHNTAIVTSSYTGPVISENGSSAFPPTGYFAYIPSATINEIGIQIIYQDYDEGPGGSRGILVYPTPIIEFLATCSSTYGDLGNFYLEATIQSLTFTVSDSLGNTANRTIGPITMGKAHDMNWVAKYVTNGSEPNRIPGYTQLTSQINVFNNGNTPGLTGNNNFPWSIVGNPTLIMGDVKIYAGTSNNTTALRDWLTGSFIMSKFPIDANGNMILNTPFATSQYAVKNQSAGSPQDFLGGNITKAGPAPRVTSAYNATQGSSYNSTVSSGTQLQSWQSGGNTTFGQIFQTVNDINVYAAGANFYSSNFTLQRVDPRVKGETAWALAPFTFPRNGTTILNLGGNNDSGNATYGHNTYNVTGFGNYGLRPSETSNRDIPGDPSPLGDNEPDYFNAAEVGWIYLPCKLYTIDSLGNATFNTPNDLGKVPTNVNWRRLRFMPRHKNETARNLIPDWAMLDVISFSSNDSSSSILKIAPINPNGAFARDITLNNSTITPRNNIPALVKALETTSAGNFQIGSAISRTAGNMTFEKADVSFGGDYTTFRGNAAIASTLNATIANRVWSSNNGTWNAWRSSSPRNWPSNTLILPSEVTEISGVADYGRRSQYKFDNAGTQEFKSIKENEGRLSAFFPGLTLQSNFFTIYAYAQAGQLQDKTQPESASNPFSTDSEALTKTLVEVEITTPATSSGTTTTPAQYKVKKLFTQPIPLGQ